MSGRAASTKRKRETQSTSSDADFDDLIREAEYELLSSVSSSSTAVTPNNLSASPSSDLSFSGAHSPDRASLYSDKLSASPLSPCSPTISYQYLPATFSHSPNFTVTSASSSPHEADQPGGNISSLQLHSVAAAGRLSPITKKPARKGTALPPSAERRSSSSRQMSRVAFSSCTFLSPSFSTFKQSPSGVGACLLNLLPMELSIRIFSFLEVSDLCSVACTSTRLKALSEDWSLWSALYVKRWRVSCIAEQAAGVWKRLYREQELSEQTAFMKGCDADQAVYFKQMQLGQRAMRTQHTTRRYNEFEIIDRWRSKHPMVRVLSSKELETHHCTSATCSYFSEGDIYICESTGKVHFCGNECDAQVTDYEGTVCHITGRSAPREATEHEHELGNAGDEIPDEAPFLAQCYEYGYNSEDGKDMSDVLFHLK